jgi:hypothetical protein
MDEFTTSTILNVPSGRDSSRTTIAKAVKIISSRTDIGLAPNIRCPYCKSQVIVGSLNSIDLLDLNGKRHFCEDPDRIAHEIKCVKQIQKIIEYYNRRELSSFQVEVNIP